MRVSKKIILSVLAIAILLVASPALAAVDSRWEGEGKGVCYPPFPTPDIHPIYAWQDWNGEIKESLDQANLKIFSGDWRDKKGNHGTFKGKVEYISITEAYCKGTWTWVYETPAAIRVYKMGNFIMKFHMSTGKCSGEWYIEDEISAEPRGVMKGYLIK